MKNQRSIAEKNYEVRWLTILVGPSRLCNDFATNLQRRYNDCTPRAVPGHCHPKVCTNVVPAMVKWGSVARRRLVGLSPVGDTANDLIADGCAVNKRTVVRWGFGCGSSCVTCQGFARKGGHRDMLRGIPCNPRQRFSSCPEWTPTEPSFPSRQPSESRCFGYVVLRLLAQQLD